MKNKNIINVTQNAWNKLKDINKFKNNNKFIFSAKSGGCNGFNYNLEVINNLDYNNLINSNLKPNIESYKNIHILIDPLSEMLLLGTKIDYQSENFNKNIYESKFLFLPDKDYASSCGCGISFTPKF